MAVVKHVSSLSEAEILSLSSSSSKWFDQGFYFPNDDPVKAYYYRVVRGAMVKYGGSFTETPDIPAETQTPTVNIIANLGIGFSADVPLPQLKSVGDTFVQKGPFKILIVNDEKEWDETEIVRGQLITDVSKYTELPPIYQYYNNKLIQIPNYAPEFIPPVDFPILPA